MSDDPNSAHPSRHSRRRGAVAEFLVVLVQAFVIAIAARSFVFQSFNIPSGSLIPTLLVGDYVFVSKYSYGYSRHSFPFNIVNFKGRIFGSEPKRGDIAVFHNDRDEGKDYIKRVIGLPGDHIRMIGALLYINNIPIKKELIGNYLTDKPNHTLREVPRYRETLPNGVSYTTIEVENGRGYLSNTSEFIVPEGHFFMMGDNREDSQDSRVPSLVGFVPFENLIGRAEVIYYSSEAENPPKSGLSALLPSKIRWDRMFHGIR